MAAALKRRVQVPINCYEFQICRASETCDCKQASLEKAPLYTADWLRRCARNPSVIRALRGIANDSGASSSNNESVIKAIAAQIASGQLRVCQGPNTAAAVAGDPGSTSSQVEGFSNKPFPFTPRTRTAPSSSQPKQSDPQTLPDDIDAAAQAAVLKAAAAQGAPFCLE